MFYSQTKCGLPYPSSAKKNYSVDGSRGEKSSFFESQFRKEIGTAQFHNQANSGLKSPQIAETKNDHLKFFSESSW